MQSEQHEQSFTFSKPTTLEAVRAAGIALIDPPPPDLPSLPLRVTCAGRLAENGEGAPRVRLDYFIEARWTLPGAVSGAPGWHDITSRRLDPGDDEAARLLFAETEEEACAIDAAIEKLLGPAARASGRRPVCREMRGGGL